MTKKQTSEYGRGTTYCLTLFLMHRDMLYKQEKEMAASGLSGQMVYQMWFNVASDHLYDLEIPKCLSKPLQKRLLFLQKRALHWGHGFDSKDEPTRKDCDWAIREALDLLMAIDRRLGVKVVGGLE